MANNSYTNIFTGNPVWAAAVSYAQYSLTGNISLNWPTQFLDTPNTLGGWTSIAASNNGFFVNLPDATLASVGQSIVFINTSTGNFSFTIRDSASTNLITLTQGQSVVLLLKDTTTAAGSWLVFPFAQGMTAVTSVGAISTSSGLTIVGSPITSVGNLTFTLASGLQAVSNLNTTGIMVQSTTGPSTMKTVSLIGGINIDVTNGDGILANPTIDLSDTLAGVVSAQIGSLTLSNNMIQTTAGNVSIQIKPNGTGSILLGQGLTPPTVDASGNITNVSTLTTNSTLTASSLSINPFVVDSVGNVIHPSAIKMRAAFVGASGAVVSSYNVTSVTRNSVGSYTIVIPGGILPGVGAVVASALSTDGTTMYVVNITGATTNTSVVVKVKDLSNNYADAPQVYVAIY